MADPTDGVVFYVDGSNNKTVKCDGIDWVIEYGVSNFRPAVLKILGDLFGDETIPNILIYFGKFSETVKFDVKFDTDTGEVNLRRIRPVSF